MSQQCALITAGRHSDFILGSGKLVLFTRIGVRDGYYGISDCDDLGRISLSSTDQSRDSSRRWMTTSHLGHFLLLSGAKDPDWAITCRVTALIHIFEAIATPGFHANNK